MAAALLANVFSSSKQVSSLQTGMSRHYTAPLPPRLHQCRGASTTVWSAPGASSRVATLTVFYSYLADDAGKQ